MFHLCLFILMAFIFIPLLEMEKEMKLDDFFFFFHASARLALYKMRSRVTPSKWIMCSTVCKLGS